LKSLRVGLSSWVEYFIPFQAQSLFIRNTYGLVLGAATYYVQIRFGSIAITELTRDNLIRFIFWCSVPVRQVTRSPAPIKGSWPIVKQPQTIDLYTKIQSTFYVSLFIVFSCHALAALGFGSSLPFCAEKRSSLLHESEGIFVALLGKHLFVVTKARRLSCCCAAVLRANTIGDSAGDEASSGLWPVPAT
jgi:cytochrome c biogenesis protein CcdA